MTRDRNGSEIVVGAKVKLSGVVTAVTPDPEGTVTVLTGPPVGTEYTVAATEIELANPAAATTEFPKLMWGHGIEITVCDQGEQDEKAGEGFVLTAPGTPEPVVPPPSVSVEATDPDDEPKAKRARK